MKRIGMKRIGMKRIGMKRIGMKRKRRCGIIVAAMLALAGVARTQGEELASKAFVPSYLWIDAWREPSGIPGAARTAAGPALHLPGSGSSFFDLGVSDEELVALFAVEPPPISRELLDGNGEEFLRYHGLPGGIVLGRVARGTGELSGARVEGSAELGIALHLADGRVVYCPGFAPDALRACLAFTAQELDALVDILSLDGAVPRLAPAFAGSPLAPLLVRMDGMPHLVLPETRTWKSLIVDREARCEVRGTELVLTADLEVRFYVQGSGSGWARRARTVEALATDFIGPRSALDLADELAPLAEIAAWLAFLRLAEELDPSGVAALRGAGLAAR